MVAPEYVTVSAIVDIYKTCGNNAGVNAGPAGYLDAANYTGGSVIDICQAGWGNQLTDIAGNIADGIRGYTLQDNADEATIVVIVNGVETTDWTYDPASNSVTVNDPPLGEGDVVDIAYNVLAECN